MTMLASDLNNPEFSNPSDPDALLHVTFFVKPFQNEFKTSMENRPIWEDVVMIRIQTPGSALNIIERAVNDSDKRRFPRHWAYFEQTQGKDNLSVGTPLTQWPILGPAQVEMLRAMKFMTVEQVAGASDEQIGRLGTAGGMAPFTLRNRARTFLTVAHDTSAVDKTAQELEALKAANAKKDAEHAEQMAAMQEQLAALAARMSAAPDEPAKRKRGRPAKVAQEA